MKTLLISAIIATVAAPAFADVNFAINHFNQDETPSERVALQDGDSVIVSTRSGALGQVIEHFNGDEDRASDKVLASSATLYSGTPAYGADIFAAMRAADSGSE